VESVFDVGHLLLLYCIVFLYLIVPLNETILEYRRNVVPLEMQIII
jgi:hypothetical protein